MSLIFSEDFTGGNKGNFDTEVIGDGIAYAGGTATLTIPVTDAPTYLMEDAGFIDNTPQANFQFDIKISDLTLASTNRAINIFSLWDGAQVALWLSLHDDDLDGEADSIKVEYQRNSGGNFADSYPVSGLADDTFVTMSIYYRAAYSNQDGGQIVVKVDGTEIADIAISDQHVSRYLVDKFAIGNAVGSNTAIQRTITFDNVKVDATGTFVSTASNLYVDPENGVDTNPGTAALPVKSAGLLSYALVAGDTITLVNNATPHRLNSEFHGAFATKVAGTAASPITITSDTGKATCTTAWLVESGGTFDWTASGTAGEFYVTQSSGDPGIGVEPYLIAVGAASDEFDDLTRIFANSKTPGSLASGEFGYGDADTLGYNTVYYKPASGSTPSRAELVFGANNCFNVAHNYTIINNLKIRSSASGIAESSTTGCVFSNNDIGYGAGYGISSSGGDPLIIGNECHYNQTHVQGAVGSENGGGFALLSASTARLEGNYGHHNADDGVDIAGTSTAVTVVGNRLNYNGSNSSDGYGIEIQTGTGAIQIHHNTCKGNTARGISLLTATASNITNNICADNSIWGLFCGTGSNVTGGENYLNGNGNSDAVGGTGTYTSATDSTDDPLIDSNDVPTSSSPVLGIGTKWWGTNPRPIGANGKPYPDFDIDIGGVQSTHSPHDPINL